MRKILMYHSVSDQDSSQIGASAYRVSPDEFKKQMQFVRHLSTLCPGCVVVTFDDGLLDNFTNALPVLKEFGLKAYFFMLSGFIGKPGYMGWNELKQLQNCSMTIGSHGISHRILTLMNETELESELIDSKQTLEQGLGKSITDFSVPRGFLNKKISLKAGQAGYRKIFSSYSTGGDSEFVLSRIAVKSDWSYEQFVRILSKGFNPKEKFEIFLKESAKFFLGARSYDALRQTLLKQ